MVKSRGFTLVELMIVVAIVGVLAAIALPAFRGYIVQSHGGAALKGVAGFARKTVVCVNSGFDCATVASDIAGHAELSADSFAGGATAFADGVGGQLHWDDGVCVATAAISSGGVIVYSAAKSVGSAASDADCQEGAGL